MAGPKTNPKNNQSTLFKSLTRLFSGPIINYRSHGEMDITRVFGRSLISNSLYRQSKFVKKV